MNVPSEFYGMPPGGCDPSAFNGVPHRPWGVQTDDKSSSNILKHASKCHSSRRAHKCAIMEPDACLVNACVYVRLDVLLGPRRFIFVMHMFQDVT